MIRLKHRIGSLNAQQICRVLVDEPRRTHWQNGVYVRLRYQAVQDGGCTRSSSNVILL